MEDKTILQQNRQAIDTAVEMLSASNVTTADMIGVCMILLEIIGGAQSEPKFSQELHTHALDRLIAAGPSAGAYAAVFS
ncbi:MAG TPA: hypothetical protein VKA60_20990 [Blastocatellia bacterium]|nr:hypothetical protein [Blastocatellia bacterium]